MTVVSRRLIYKFLLDFVYPNRCPICGSFIKWDELLCKNCECKLSFHKEILCEKCGKDKCLDHDSLHFDSIYTLMRYEDICVKAIHQLKDDRQLNFAEYSAKLLGNLLRKNGVADQAISSHQCQCTDQNAVKGDMIRHKSLHTLLLWSLG